MSTGFLSEIERARLDRFPADLFPADLIQYFTLTPEDRDAIPVWGAESNRLGFALQLGALRLLGYFPDDLRTAPNAVLDRRFVRDIGLNYQNRAERLVVGPGEVGRCGVAIGHDHRVTLLEKPLGGALADASGPAGDQSHFHCVVHDDGLALGAVEINDEAIQS